MDYDNMTEPADELDEEREDLAETTEETEPGEDNEKPESLPAAAAPRLAPALPLTPGQRAFFARDVLDFVANYPQFGIEEVSTLENNPQFRKFCGSRFGREPLSRLFGDYLALVDGAEKSAAAKAARRKARSTGGGAAGKSALTPEQKRTLDAWNAEHPEMAMTAREFLER